jgi:hypothetical protein
MPRAIENCDIGDTQSSPLKWARRAAGTVPGMVKNAISNRHRSTIVPRIA